jgi:hypothetical protein
MAKQKILTSVHGNRLGINKDGVAIGPEGYPAADRTAVQSEAASSVGTTLENYGLIWLSSGSSLIGGGNKYEIKPPVAGVEVKLFIDSPSSAAVFGPTDSSVVFVANGASGSTILVAGAAIRGQSITLMGISSTKYAITGSTANITVG